MNVKPNINQVVSIEQLKEIDVPPNRILIDGSGVMALYGIRQNKDLDIAIPLSDWSRILNDFPGKYEVAYRSFIKVMVLVYKNVEIHYNDWDGSRTEDTLERTEVIGGYHWHSLDTIYKWKKLANREKDIKDVQLIEKFWELKNKGELSERRLYELINKRLKNLL